MVINSERLILIPLDIEDIESAIRDEKSIFKKYGFSGIQPTLTEEEKNIYQIKLEHMREDLSTQLFSTYFWMQHRVTKEYVGEIGFKSFKESFFSLEVGYSIVADFQGHGYMTEALRALVGWAFGQSLEGLVYIIATTRKDNFASRKVLEKIGFKIYSNNEEDLRWMIDRELFEEKVKESK